MVIRRVDPVSLAKVTGALYAIAGLVFGGVFSLFALAGGFATMAFAVDPAQRFRSMPFFGMGTLAIIVLPILYGAMGFVTALIGGWLYNLVAGVTGGIRIELQQE